MYNLIRKLHIRKIPERLPSTLKKLKASIVERSPEKIKGIEN